MAEKSGGTGKTPDFFACLCRRRDEDIAPWGES